MAAKRGTTGKRRTGTRKSIGPRARRRAVRRLIESGPKVTIKKSRVATKAEVAGAKKRAAKRGKKLKEAVSTGGSFPIDPIDFGIHGDDKFRRITTQVGFRDFTLLTHERMQELGFAFSRTHPFAWRIVKLHEAFAIGGPVKWDAPNPKVRAALEEFWFDPVNDWPTRLPKKARELVTFGEWFQPMFVRSSDGRVRVGTVDPREVTGVIPNPDNADEILTIETSKALTTRGVAVFTTETIDTVSRRVVHLDEMRGSPTIGRMVGDIFFFAVNQISKSLRGISDLSPILDWLDIQDANLFNVAESDLEARSFIWDITVDGATEEQVKAIKDEIEGQEIKPGSFRVHNNKVTWEAVAPNLQASDAETVARLIKLHILAGAGFPEHWFAEAGGANKAVASEMGIPTTRQLYERQTFFRHAIEKMFRFVIDQKVIAGVIRADEDLSFKIKMPALWVRDMAQIADGLSKVSTSLSLAVQEGWITGKTAGMVFVHMLAQLGFEVDSEKEAEETANQETGGKRFLVGNGGRLGSFEMDDGDGEPARANGNPGTTQTP